MKGSKQQQKKKKQKQNGNGATLQYTMSSGVVQNIQNNLDPRRVGKPQ